MTDTFILGQLRATAAAFRGVGDHGTASLMERAADRIVALEGQERGAAAHHKAHHAYETRLEAALSVAREYADGGGHMGVVAAIDDALSNTHPTYSSEET